VRADAIERIEFVVDVIHRDNVRSRHDLAATTGWDFRDSSDTNPLRHRAPSMGK
jgi:hypothetical protein